MLFLDTRSGGLKKLYAIPHQEKKSDLEWIGYIYGFYAQSCLQVPLITAVTALNENNLRYKFQAVALRLNCLTRYKSVPRHKLRRINIKTFVQL